MVVFSGILGRLEPSKTSVWPPTVATSPGASRSSASEDVGLRRGERDGDEHDAEVDDHAAVGPADEAAPALAPGGEHDLADGGAAGEGAEAEGEHRAPAHGCRTRTEPTTAATAATAGQNRRTRSSSLDALRHGSTGATAIMNSSSSPMGMVMRLK